MTSVPTLCEMTTYILVTQPVYADIHPGLVTIPLDMEQEFYVPYGLMIANDPSPAVKRFISAVERIRDIHIQNGIFSDKPQSQLFRFPVILPEPASSGMNESPANTASAPQGCKISVSGPCILDKDGDFLYNIPNQKPTWRVGKSVNFIFISPNFPHTYWQFCDRLKKNGANVLGIGDAAFDALDEPLKNALTEYYRVTSLENYDEVYRAVAYFASRYGHPDWLESNNEYWLEQDARLRTDFHITTGIQTSGIGAWKHKSSMKPVYASASIPTARCHPVSTLAAARDFIAQNGGYPVIAKPDVGVGAANTWKLEDDRELEAFFEDKPNVPYLIEEFVEGDICSYDAVVDSHSAPLFESMTVWPPSVADIVNRDLDLSYYTCPAVPEPLEKLGRAALAAFGVKSRFVHLEFFRLTKARAGLGEVGDFVALEVNMRPAGGYTPDMMDYAHSTDVYQIWADMVTADKRLLPDSGEHHWCVYASRKDSHRYRHTHEEILEKYGDRIVMCERMPELMWATMGCQMYTAHAYSEEEVRAFVAFVHEREAEA